MTYQYRVVELSRMSEKRYELDKHFGMVVGKRTLYRIQALKKFDTNGAHIFEGDYGGYVEKEDNLSQEGTSWVFGLGAVYGNARVEGNATVSSLSEQVLWNSFGKSYGFTHVFGNVKMSGNAVARENSVVRDNVVLCDDADVVSSVLVGDVVVKENAKFHSSAAGEQAVFGGNCIFERTIVQGENPVFGGTFYVKGSYENRVDELREMAESKTDDSYIPIY